MATYYIAPSGSGGSDSNAGTTGSPWLTITHANTIVVAGDIVKMRTGTYALSDQALISGVTYMNDTGHTPVWDGGNTTANAVISNSNTTIIDGIEVRNYKQGGIYMAAASAAATGNNIVRNCHIHNCGGVDPAQDVHEWGVQIVYGTGNKVYNNHIHHIGQGGEAIGVWVLDASGVEVYSNEIHHCRKEGIRDWRGLNPWVHDNRIYACWNPLSPNSSVGGLWENNYTYDSQQGINPKEMNNDVEGSLTLWGLLVPSTPVLDTFSGTLSSWTTPFTVSGPGAAMVISAGRMQPTTSGTWADAAWTTAFVADQEVYADVPTVVADIWIYARYQNPLASVNAYVGGWESGTFYLQKIVAGVTSTLTSTAGTLSSGDGFWLKVIGNQITLYKRSSGVWTQVLQTTDSSVTGGGQIVVQTPNGQFDNVGGGAVGTAPANERTKIWHNTFYNSSFAGVVYGPNGPAEDVDVKNNIFAGTGSQYIWDYSTVRTAYTQDYNLFAPTALDWASVARPRLYHDMYDPNAGFQDTLANLYTATGFEQHGTIVDPQLNNPATGDLDYPNTSPAYNSGTDLTAAREAHYGTSRGQQMGARGLPPARKKWTDITATVLSWSSNNFYNPYIQGVSDRQADSYVITDTAGPETFVLDLGSSKSFDHVIMAQFAHFDARDIQQWKWETGTSSSGPWTQIATGTNPDSEGSMYVYDLGAVYTSRYLRFTAVSSWTSSGATTIAVNDVRVGLLENAGLISAQTGALSSAGINKRKLNKIIRH